MRVELVETYLAERVRRGDYAPESVRTARPILGQWHRHAGPIECWSPDLAESWVHDQSIAPNTRKGRLSRLRPYVAWLIRHDHLARDITADITVRVRAGAPRDLPVDQVARLLAGCPDERAELIVLLMAHCGLRCIDLSRALVEDIDVGRRVLAVRAKGGRGEVTHWVPIPTEAWTALARHLLAEGRSRGPLIRNARRATPTPITANRLSKLVGDWMRDAGLKGFPCDGVSAHALRHSCAQQMLDRGASLREVQHALGHAHQSTTEGYLRREPPGLREAMEGRRYLRAV